VRGRTLIAAAAVAVTFAGATPASSVSPLERSALKALATPRIDAPTAARGRAEVRRAAYLARVLPSGRREHVAVALGEIASFAGRMTEPRALALIGELKANDDYFLKHWAPSPKTDITDADGVVYRYFAGRCFEFHPLANFGALNARVAAGDADGAQRLAGALVARGVYQSGGGIGWEYTFPFGGGRAPWLSGMAQAVAAQALARTAGLVLDQTESASLMGKARAAYQAIPGRLLTSVAAGPWVRLYSFTSLPVLNAQLQAVISLQSYATTADDADAAALAARMQRAAAGMLPRFDTGYWSYYALPHDPSPLDYHEYVVQLLKRLGPADPRFADAANRFAAYEKQPPAFQLASGSLGALTFWVSKPSTVSVTTGAGPSRRATFDGGWHTLSWGVPKRPGSYGVHLTATDSAGNHASFDALPIVRATSTVAKRTAQSAAEVTPPPAPSFRVGAALSDPSQSPLAGQAGLHLVRIDVTWPAGATVPDPTLVAALQEMTQIDAVVELIAAPLPADEAGRAALAQYAAALAANVTSLNALILGPAPAATDVPAYRAAFDAIRAALPDSALGIAVDGSTSPAGTVAGLAGSDANTVAFRPAVAPAKGAWTLADLSRLRSGLPDASIVIDAAPAPFATTLETAACTPGVTGVLLDRLSDATRAGLRSTISTAERGAFVCPGLTAEAVPFAVQYPTSLTQPSAVALNCNRDCLYLVTLDRADGRPVVARRGQIKGGPSSELTTVTLPKAKLTSGAYKVDVRLVARVNPGPVTRYLSPLLSAR
jgi:pyruvate/2-oxoglutarate dehydrogenase complex dihydrolipoamide acyltransferase (E2) component